MRTEENGYDGLHQNNSVGIYSEVVKRLYSQAEAPDGRWIFRQSKRFPLEYFVYSKGKQRSLVEKDPPGRCLPLVNSASKYELRFFPGSRRLPLFGEQR